MHQLLLVAAVMTVLGVLLVSGNVLAQQERQEMTVLIPMQYMSAEMAARIFGGVVIPAVPQQGYAGQPRGGYGGGYGGADGGYRSGTNIGGGSNFGYGYSPYR